MDATTENRYEVVSPKGKRSGGGEQYAQRSCSLDGKTIAQLWNWSFQGDKIFPMIRKELEKQYAGIKFVGYESFGSFAVPDGRGVVAAIPDKLRRSRCDAVITGIGC